MSYVKHSRRPPDVLLSRVTTFADFFAEGWELRTRCRQCRVEHFVQREAIERLKMMHRSPWDRRPRCTKIAEIGGRCSGKADYFGCHPQDSRWFQLTRKIPDDGLQ